MLSGDEPSIARAPRAGTTHAPRAAAALAAVLLVLTGCGGNEPPASSQSQAPPSSEAPPSQSAEAASPHPGDRAPLVASHEPAGSQAAGAGDSAPASHHGGGFGAQSAGPELQWDTPAGWTSETPGNPMRRAQYTVPAQGGDLEDAECVVFYFGPGQGGDATANVTRWAAQFTTAEGGKAVSRVSERKLGTRSITRVEVDGVYHPMSVTFGGAPPTAKPGYRLLGAIVPGADANWFFRCTGPDKTIQANRKAFDALLASIRWAAP